MLEETVTLQRPVKDLARRVELALGRTNLRIEGDVRSASEGAPLARVVARVEGSTAMGFAMGLAVGVLYTLRAMGPR